MTTDRDFGQLREIAHLREIMDERDKRYNARFEAQDQAVKAALAASKEAVLKAEAAVEKRFESVNEFRGALQDAATHNVPRNEHLAFKDTMNTRTDALAARIERIEGKSAGLNAGWVLLVGAIAAAGVITAIIARFSS